jgi:hypothetical protein
VGVLAFFGLWQMLIIRPQTVSLLLFVLLYAALEASWGRRGWLVFPPVLLAVWANVHGGFPVGLILIGCYVLAAAVSTREEAPESDHVSRVGMARPSVFLRRIWSSALAVQEKGAKVDSKQSGAAAPIRWSAVGRRAMPWGICLLVSVAATLANPYGWHVYQYVGLTSQTASARHIDEWLPPGLGLLAGKVWVLSLVGTLILFALPGRRPTRRELCLVCCFLPLACGSVRMVAWWLLVSTPVLAAQLAANWPRAQAAEDAARQPSWVAAAACGALLAAAALSVPWFERYNPVLSLPGRGHRTESDLQAAADHLAAGKRGGRIFTRFAWGEYLSWSLAPRYTVFMDGRIEIFPDEVWEQYSAVTRGRGDWEEILTHYGVDCLLLDTTGYHHDLLPLVRQRPSLWRQTFRQGSLVLFERQRQVAGR